eukprot:gene13540-16005_t
MGVLPSVLVAMSADYTDASSALHLSRCGAVAVMYLCCQAKGDTSPWMVVTLMNLMVISDDEEVVSHLMVALWVLLTVRSVRELVREPIREEDQQFCSTVVENIRQCPTAAAVRELYNQQQNTLWSRVEESLRRKPIIPGCSSAASALKAGSAPSGDLVAWEEAGEDGGDEGQWWGLHRVFKVFHRWKDHIEAAREVGSCIKMVEFMVTVIWSYLVADDKPIPKRRAEVAELDRSANMDQQFWWIVHVDPGGVDMSTMPAVLQALDLLMWVLRLPHKPALDIAEDQGLLGPIEEEEPRQKGKEGEVEPEGRRAPEAELGMEIDEPGDEEAGPEALLTHALRLVRNLSTLADIQVALAKVLLPTLMRAANMFTAVLQAASLEWEAAPEEHRVAKQLAIGAMWNMAVRRRSLESYVVGRGAIPELVAILHGKRGPKGERGVPEDGGAWPPALRDAAGMWLGEMLSEWSAMSHPSAGTVQDLQSWHQLTDARQHAKAPAEPQRALSLSLGVAVSDAVGQLAVMELAKSDNARVQACGLRVLGRMTCVPPLECPAPSRHLDRTKMTLVGALVIETLARVIRHNLDVTRRKHKQRPGFQEEQYVQQGIVNLCSGSMRNLATHPHNRTRFYKLELQHSYVIEQHAATNPTPYIPPQAPLTSQPPSVPSPSKDSKSGWAKRRHAAFAVEAINTMIPRQLFDKRWVLRSAREDTCCAVF